MRIQNTTHALERVRHAPRVSRSSTLSPRTIARRAQLDAPMAASIAQLVSALPKPPAPRNRYDDCRYPHRLNYRPWELLAALIDDVIDAAHLARIAIPERDILAPLDALRRYFIARLARPLPPVRMCVVDETEKEGAANPTELPLMDHPSRIDLERADAALAEHERAIGRLREAIAQELARTGRLSA